MRIICDNVSIFTKPGDSVLIRSIRHNGPNPRRPQTPSAGNWIGHDDGLEWEPLNVCSDYTAFNYRADIRAGPDSGATTPEVITSARQA